MRNTKHTIPESVTHDKPESTDAGISDMTKHLLNLQNAGTIPDTIPGSRKETRCTEKSRRIPSTRAEENTRAIRSNGQENRTSTTTT